MNRSSEVNAIVSLWSLAESATVFASIIWGHKTPRGLAMGVPFLGVGLLLAFVSWEFLGNAKGRLVTSGPYAYSRHPFYMGLLLMLTGVVISLSSMVGLVMLILSLGASVLRAMIEERELAEQFLDEYRTYIERTPFIIGFPRCSAKGRRL